MKETWEWQRRDGTTLRVTDYDGRIFALVDGRDGEEELAVSVEDAVRKFMARVR